MREFIYKNSLWLLIIWWLIILILCATPGSYIPSANWMELLSVDKWVHAAVFFILASLVILQHKKTEQKKYYLLGYLFLCVFYGVTLEWMQAKFFSERYADWQDIVANTFGCAVALVMASKIGRYFSTIQT